jgi:hypothetical protein
MCKANAVNVVKSLKQQLTHPVGAIQGIFGRLVDDVPWRAAAAAKVR